MHGVVQYSIVGVREAISRAARVSKKAGEELCHHDVTLTCTTFWDDGARCLVTYTWVEIVLDIEHSVVYVLVSSVVKGMQMGSFAPRTT